MKAPLAAAIALCAALAGCGPPGSQGAPITSWPATWGSAGEVSYDTAPAAVQGSNLQAALDGVFLTAQNRATAQQRFLDPVCGIAYGGTGADFGGFTGANQKCSGAGEACVGEPTLHACSVSEINRSYALGNVAIGMAEFQNSEWVYDPSSCLGLSTASTTAYGIAFQPANAGLARTRCDNANSGAVMCCR